NLPRQEPPPSRPRLAGTPAWSACRYPAYRRRRLPGAAQLFDQFASRGGVADSDGGEGGQWRGVSISRRRSSSRRPIRIAWTDRSLFRMDRRHRRAPFAPNTRVGHCTPECGPPSPPPATNSPPSPPPPLPPPPARPPP